MSLLKSYEQMESAFLFIYERTPLSTRTKEHVAAIAMKIVTDAMQEVYDATLEHCATFDPGTKIRDEIKELRNELINKLIK